MGSTMRDEKQASVGAIADDSTEPWRDGVAAGLFVVVLGALGLMAVLGEVFPDALPFLAVFVGLGVGAARSSSTRLRWAIAALMTLFVGINMVFALGDLSHPESAGPFIATSVVIAGGVVTVALAALAARRRPLSAARVWAGAFGVLGVAAVGSLMAATGVENDVAQPGDGEVIAEDFEFPEQVSVPSSAGGLLLRNDDAARHTFVVEGQVDPVEMPANSQKRVDLDLGPGTYRYFCDIAGHEAMEGELIVG